MTEAHRTDSAGLTNILKKKFVILAILAAIKFSDRK
jgi:hypothetical protein